MQCDSSLFFNALQHRKANSVCVCNQELVKEVESGKKVQNELHHRDSNIELQRTIVR